MGFQDYIGEAEACSFAGVSAATLRRFAEAGYFQIETDSDGLRLFSKSEIENLFGLKPMTSSRPRSSAATPTPSPVAPLMPAPAHLESAGDTALPPLTSGTKSSPTHIEVSAEAPKAQRSATTVVRAPVEDVTHTDAPLMPSAPHEVSPLPESPRVGRESATPVGAPLRAEAIESLEREVTKFQNIVALQEKLLDIREEEIKNLKGERDWLRSRIEKLEEKNERDQLLLLAETQTVRQLINLQQRKRSTVQLALEWLGLKSPQAAPGQPIDISPSSPTVRTTTEAR